MLIAGAQAIDRLLFAVLPGAMAKGEATSMVVEYDENETQSADDYDGSGERANACLNNWITAGGTPNLRSGSKIVLDFYRDFVTA